MKQNTGMGANYVYLLLGGLFLLALLVVIGYGLAANEGCVGVVTISGELQSEDSPATLFSDAAKGTQTMAEELEEANSRADVKSILILIDSPGGSVVASRELYDAIKKVNKSKVSYIHEMAASGGYYAAAGTDYIMANPSAITGSIGARSTFEDMSGLFEKVGYNLTVIKSGDKKDMGNPGRALSEEEIAIMQSIVDEDFAEFKAAVAESRGSRLDAAGFENATDGRIMTGRQAKRIGLVDGLGSKKDALKKAAEMGGINGEDPATCEISLGSNKRGLFGSLASSAYEAAARATSALPKFSYK